MEDSTTQTQQSLLMECILESEAFEEYKADLYKKKTGEYFLYESGGPMSRMAVNVSYNEVTGSENITPLTVSEVKKWLEDNNLAEAYEKLFNVTEGRTLKELRSKKGLTQSELAEKAGVPVGHIQKNMRQAKEISIRLKALSY